MLVHVHELVPNQCEHLGYFTSVFLMGRNWNLRHTIAEPEFALSDLIPLIRVRLRRIRSYIPGTIIRAADRYFVSVGIHTLLMGEYLRLPIYQEVSLILVLLFGRHLTKQLSAAINHHSCTQPLKEHKCSPQQWCKPSHSAIKRCYTQGE